MFGVTFPSFTVNSNDVLGISRHPVPHICCVFQHVPETISPMYNYKDVKISWQGALQPVIPVSDTYYFITLLQVFIIHMLTTFKDTVYNLIMSNQCIHTITMPQYNYKQKGEAKQKQEMFLTLKKERCGHQWTLVQPCSGRTGGRSLSHLETVRWFWPIVQFHRKETKYMWWEEVQTYCTGYKLYSGLHV